MEDSCPSERSIPCEGSLEEGDATASICGSHELPGISRLHELHAQPSVKEEMMTCLEVWNTENQTRLDEACKTILTALNECKESMLQQMASMQDSMNGHGREGCIETPASQIPFVEEVGKSVNSDHVQGPPLATSKNCNPVGSDHVRASWKNGEINKMPSKDDAVTDFVMAKPIGMCRLASSQEEFDKILSHQALQFQVKPQVQATITACQAKLAKEKASAGRASTMSLRSVGSTLLKRKSTREQARASNMSLRSVRSTLLKRKSTREQARFSARSRQFAMENRTSDMQLLKSIAGAPKGDKRWGMLQSVVTMNTGFPDLDDGDDAPVRETVLQQFVRSTTFDLLCALVIVGFMVSLGWETNDTVHRGGTSSRAFFIVSLCFNGYFTMELLLRIAADRCDFFCGEDMFLNVMDICLILTSVADMIVGVLLKDQSQIGLNTDAVSRLMRGLRILRAVRIVRLARFMRYIYQLRKMVCLIQSCFSTLFWCLVILAAFVYTFAILFTQGVTDYIFQYEDSDDDKLSVLDELHMHYGSVEKSMNSLFQSMTTGVSWGMLFDPLKETGWLYPALFVLFITLSLFGVLNVMTSVFIESTMKSALSYRDLIITDNERTKQIAVKHLREVFTDIDLDGDGTLSFQEILCFLADPNVYTYMEALDINLNDARTLFHVIDTDGSGAIDIDEFCDGCLRLKGGAKAFDIHCLICELSKFFEKWSRFTNFAANRLDSIEASVRTLPTGSSVPEVPCQLPASRSRSGNLESRPTRQPTVNFATEGQG